MNNKNIKSYTPLHERRVVMSQIIIEGNSGQLRMNAASLNLLIEEEIESLFKIGKKLKESQENEDERIRE